MLKTVKLISLYVGILSDFHIATHIAKSLKGKFAEVLPQFYFTSKISFISSKHMSDIFWTHRNTFWKMMSLWNPPWRTTSQFIALCSNINHVWVACSNCFKPCAFLSFDLPHTWKWMLILSMSSYIYKQQKEIWSLLKHQVLVKTNTGE